MLSCHKIIKDEICYNEIVNDRQLFSNSPINREFEGCIIQQSDGSLMACAKLEAGDISLFYENSIKKRDTVSQFLTLLGKNYEINFEWRKSKKFFKYISCEKIMTGSAREIESRRRENFENYNNYINELYITLIKRNFNPSVLMTRGDFDEFCQCMQSLSSAFSNIACICSFLKNSELICYLKSCLDLTDIKVMDFKHDNSLSDCLLTENYLMKTIPLIIEGEERKFISCLSLTALPSFTQPDLFNFCSYVDCDFRLVIKYKNYDRNESFNKLNHKKK